MAFAYESLIQLYDCVHCISWFIDAVYNFDRSEYVSKSLFHYMEAQLFARDLLKVL